MAQKRGKIKLAVEINSNENFNQIVSPVKARIHTQQCRLFPFNSPYTKCDGMVKPSRHIFLRKVFAFFIPPLVLRKYLGSSNSYRDLEEVTVDGYIHSTALKLGQAFCYRQTETASLGIPGFVTSDKPFRKLFGSNV